MLQILKENKDTTYGQKYKFADMHSREDFVKNHPITTHEHFQAYLDRIMNGEENVLSSKETRGLISTSGTTGISKIYPVTLEGMKIFWTLNAEVLPCMTLHLRNLQRFARFHIFPDMKKTPGGIPIGPGSMMVPVFPQDNLIPAEYSRLHKEDASYYAQAVFSLAERELGFIVGFSADLMYSYMKFITQNWENLCEDINNGQIGTKIDMPDDVREDLSRRLKADPKRATELRSAMKDGIVGLAKRIWPDMSFITMAKSGGFKMAADFLMENQLKDIKIIDFGHSATEGVTGCNLEGPDSHLSSIYTLSFFPWFFIELIPLELVDQENPTAIFPEQVHLQ